MNFDASFAATPGVARRLLSIASLGKIDVEDEILALARQDLVPEEFFKAHNHNAEERRAVQFIRDCDYRCIVPFGTDKEKWTGNGEKLILSALSFPDAPRPVTIATQNQLAWRLTLMASKLIDQNDVVIVTHHDAVKDAHFTKERRGGVLIISWEGDDHGDHNHKALVREFPRSIVVGKLAPIETASRFSPELTCLAEMSEAMFPEIPSVMLTKKMVTNSVLRSYGYLRTRLLDVAPFFNLFIPIPNLIPPD